MSGFVAGRYATLATDRTEYLNRARKCALLTIPTLFPPENATASTTYPSPHQSIGSRGVNNMSSKLLLTLFPSNSPFFKLPLTRKAMQRLKVDPQFKAEAELALSEVEQEAMRSLEGRATRTSLFQAFRQLLTGGNVLLYFPKNAKPRVFNLNNYACRRDNSGKLLELVVCEVMKHRALPKELKDLISDKAPAASEGPDKGVKVAESEHKLYTYIWWTENRYRVYQEIEGLRVPGSDGSYTEDGMRWIPIRFNSIDGEHYGRGYIEEYFGDLQSLETLTEAMLGSSTIVSKLVWLISPNSSIRPKEFTAAENGDALVGNEGDIKSVQAERGADMQVTMKMMDVIEQRLGFAFLLNTAVQRNGERVTAEEIRFMARELEDALGGTYSVLSQDLQLPLAKLTLADVDGLGSLPKDLVLPTIITGMDALGRGNDLQKLDLLIGGAVERFGPTALQYFDMSDYLTRRATALNLELGKLIKTGEQVAQEQQQQQTMALAASATPNLVNQVGKAMQPEKG